MVTGLDRFAQHFAAYRNRHVLIGGAATFIALDSAALDSRVTKDLDIVLRLEALDVEFAEAFWGFVEAGGYEIAQRSTGAPAFYRFLNPADKSYPEMIELFARKPDLIDPPSDSHLAPIPISSEVSSLSAILLDDDYYRLVIDGARDEGDLTVLAPTHLIPLKAKAWLDLTLRRERGEGVDSKDVKKHRNDVLRLSQLIAPDDRVPLSESVRSDLADFVAKALQGGPEPKVFGVIGATLADARELLTEVYDLASPSS
jgi:hypothetical protein